MAEKPQHLRPGQVFGRRVREERMRQQLSLRELTNRVSALGVPLDRSTLVRIEQGGTRGNLDTLFALAVALGVSPIHLMVPRQAGEKMSLLGNRTLPADDAQAWIRGRKLLRDSDPQA